jgi:hypothetical protein
VAITLSLSPHSGITLSRGLILPSTLLPGLAPQPGRSSTLLGLRSPYHHLAACTRPQERGAAVSLQLISAPCVHFWASPITTPPPPPPSGLAVLTPIIYNQGTTETDAHTSYPLCPFPHTIVYHPCSFSLAQHFFISPLINPPLIPLPHIMGNCRARTATLREHIPKDFQ